MVHTALVVIVLTLSRWLIFSTVLGSQQQYLQDLRWFKSVGVAGRFVVNRNALEQVLQNRKQQDAACGQEVKLQLPKSLPHSSYNISQEGEVLLSYGTITDKTLSDELPNCLKEKVATSYQQLLIAMPVILGKNEEPGLLFLNLFTNSTKMVPVPFSTSISEVTHVDSIEEEDDGRVTLRIRDDVITFQVQDEAEADDGMEVGKDFDKVYGRTIAITGYPLSFDWGCSLLGSQISFCQDLNNVRCELSPFGGNVCALSSTRSGERSSTSMKIVNMTGIFQDMFPFLAETVPSVSFEAETINKELSTGITYPCLTS